MTECEVTICEHSEDDIKETAIKKGNRRTSEMWNFFTAISSDYALCNLCNQKFSYKTSTSNLRKHIVCRHSSVQALGNSIKFSDENKSPPSPLKKDNQLASAQRSRKKENFSPLIAETLKRQLFTEMNHVSEKSNSWSADRRMETDEFDAYGITVAAKLRRMTDNQRLFCEKIINDALFKAALEQLTPLSEIVICLPTSSSNEPS